MKIKILLTVLLALLSVFAEAQNEYVYPLPAKPHIFSNDSLLKIIKDNNLSVANNYVAKNNAYWNTLGKLGKFQELLIFNSKGNKLKFYEGIKCANNLLLLNGLELEKLDEDASVALQSFNGNLDCYTTTSSGNYDYTAIIFWSVTLGMEVADNPFDWERKLIEQLGDKIRIIKVNMDINENWSEENKKKNLARLKQVLKAIKASGK